MYTWRIAVTAFVGACAFAQDAAYQAYFERIAELQRDGAAIAQREGRAALVRQYRDLIDAHPGYANNIRLETQIAMLYESDFSEWGQPPDLLAAHETYQNIVASYGPDDPYMATVRKLAADRAADFDPALAQQMYEEILTDYPEEDALTVQTQYALGKLAEGQGDPAAAEQHYNQILSYAPSGARVSDAQNEEIAAYQENAVASMLTTAIKGADTPQDRLKALKKYLEKHQELEAAHGELVRHFAKSIEGGRGASVEQDDADATTVEALLASMKKDKSGGGREDDRARAREQRARDAGAARPRADRQAAAVAPSDVAGPLRDLAGDAAAAPANMPPASGPSRKAPYIIMAAVTVGIVTAAIRIARRPRGAA